MGLFQSSIRLTAMVTATLKLMTPPTTRTRLLQYNQQQHTAATAAIDTNNTIDSNDDNDDNDDGAVTVTVVQAAATAATVASQVDVNNTQVEPSVAMPLVVEDPKTILLQNVDCYVSGLLASFPRETLNKMVHEVLILYLQS